MAGNDGVLHLVANKGLKPVDFKVFVYLCATQGPRSGRVPKRQVDVALDLKATPGTISNSFGRLVRHGYLVEDSIGYVLNPHVRFFGRPVVREELDKAQQDGLQRLMRPNLDSDSRPARRRRQS